MCVVELEDRFKILNAVFRKFRDVFVKRYRSQELGNFRELVLTRLLGDRSLKVIDALTGCFCKFTCVGWSSYEESGSCCLLLFALGWG